MAQFLASNAADSYQFPPLGGTERRSVTGEAALLGFIGWRAVRPFTPVQKWKTFSTHHHRMSIKNQLKLVGEICRLSYLLPVYMLFFNVGFWGVKFRVAASTANSSLYSHCQWLCVCLPTEPSLYKNSSISLFTKSLKLLN